MLEFEKKLMLSRDEYEALCQSFEGTIHGQTNFYYDTAEFAYDRKGITCRIREKNNRYQATIKTHLLSVENCSAERSAEAKSKYDASLFEGMDVSFQGQLQTSRKDVLTPSGIHIIIDKNRYLGIEDYELEIEYPPLLEPLCDDVLRTVAVTLSAKDPDRLLKDLYDRMKKSITKSGRFFARKRELQGSD